LGGNVDLFYLGSWVYRKKVSQRFIRGAWGKFCGEAIGEGLYFGGQKGAQIFCLLEKG